MTFSDPDVAAFVNKHFVSAWFNRSPGFVNHDYEAEEAIFLHYGEAFGSKNICTFVMTPEGKVFTYVAGYLGPGPFLEFAKNALALRKEAFDEKMTLREEGLGGLRKLHQARGASVEKAAKDPERSCQFSGYAYREVKHRHGSICDHFRASSLLYLARLHEYWGRVKALPELSNVRYRYLYENSFTEEGQGATLVEKDPDAQ